MSYFEGLSPSKVRHFFGDTVYFSSSLYPENGIMISCLDDVIAAIRVYTDHAHMGNDGITSNQLFSFTIYCPNLLSSKIQNILQILFWNILINDKDLKDAQS